MTARLAEAVIAMLIGVMLGLGYLWFTDYTPPAQEYIETYCAEMNDGQTRVVCVDGNKIRQVYVCPVEN